MCVSINIREVCVCVCVSINICVHGEKSPGSAQVLSCDLDGYLVSKERSPNPFLILGTLRSSVYYGRQVTLEYSSSHLSSFWLPFRF